MNKCGCYHERVLPNPSGLFGKILEGYCYGTKEMDCCSCGGDLAKCDFYPEKRRSVLTENVIPNETTVYYAHHQWKYRSKIEEYELDLIKRYFPHASIFNPSIDLKTKSINENEIMEECLERVRESDIFVFSSMDGCIGTGVYHEIKEAEKNNKLVLYIFHDTLLTNFDIVDKSPLNRSDRLYAMVVTHFI